MGIKRDLIQSPAKNCQNNCSYHTKCYHHQVGEQLCVREFRPFSELISQPWLWKSSEDIYFCQSLHRISELSLKIMHLLSFLWSSDGNFKIERALHFLIQLWITCKMALHLNFIIFLNLDFLKAMKVRSEIYLQHSECIHQSGSGNICQGYCPGITRTMFSNFRASWLGHLMKIIEEPYNQLISVKIIEESFSKLILVKINKESR